MMIPKTIHFCWFGGKKIPKSIKKNIDSWGRLCPAYEIIRWDESNFDYKIDNYPYEAYDAKKWAFLSDYARLWIVYHYGGIYLDTDVRLIKPLDELLDYKAYFGIEKTDNLCIDTGLGFGAEKGNAIVKELLDQYEDIHFKLGDGKYDFTPCPDRNIEVFERYGYHNRDEMVRGDEFVILPSEYLCPMEYATRKIDVTENTISIHYYQGSWEKKTTRIKSKIARLLHVVK